MDTMIEKLISVIIPAYNTAHLIGRSIKSVLSQTYQNFEIIVVDDGSTDELNEVVTAFNDNRIQYIRHEVNRGGSAARNTGVQNAKGNYIAFLDSDDEWLPEKLEKQIKVFQSTSSNIGVVYTGWRWIRDKDNIIIQEKIPIYRGDVSRIILEEDGIGSLSTPLVKKDILTSIGGLDEKLPSRQDWDLWIRLSKVCEMDFVPEILVNYYLRSGSISTNVYNKIYGTEQVLEKYKSDFLSHPKILSKQYILLTILNLILNNTKKSRFYLRKSISLNPFDIKTYWKSFIHFILSLTPVKFREWFFHLMRRINKDFYWIYPD